jgi:RND family efflux transporter MFP subunit
MRLSERSNAVLADLDGDVGDTLVMARPPSPSDSGMWLAPQLVAPRVHPLRRQRFAAVGVLALLALAMTLAVAAVARKKDGAVQRERVERERASALGPRVSVVTVAIPTTMRPLTLTGEVQPFRQVTLYAKVSGYLKDVRFDKGDEVKKGQVLGVLEAPEADQVAKAASADLQAKHRNAERSRALAEHGTVSPQDVERAVADSEMAAATYVKARSLKDYAVIRAPFDGTVTARHADPGALLQAATSAAPGALPLADVADLSRVRVRVYVGPFDAPFVHEGLPVTLWTDARPDRTMKASITRFTHALDARTRTMLCEIDVDNTDRSLYAGTPVRVRLEVETPRLPVVPAEAVNIRDGRPQVALVRDGHAAFVPVELAEDDGKVARIQRGVRENDVVIVNVGDDVSDGAPVQPVARETAKPAGAAR